MSVKSVCLSVSRHKKSVNATEKKGTKKKKGGQVLGMGEQQWKSGGLGEGEGCGCTAEPPTALRAL